MPLRSAQHLLTCLAAIAVQAPLLAALSTNLQGMQEFLGTEAQPRVNHLPGSSLLAEGIPALNPGLRQDLMSLDPSAAAALGGLAPSAGAMPGLASGQAFLQGGAAASAPAIAGATAAVAPSAASGYADADNAFAAGGGGVTAAGVAPNAASDYTGAFSNQAENAFARGWQKQQEGGPAGGAGGATDDFVELDNGDMQKAPTAVDPRAVEEALHRNNQALLQENSGAAALLAGAAAARAADESLAREKVCTTLGGRSCTRTQTRLIVQDLEYTETIDWTNFCLQALLGLAIVAVLMCNKIYVM